MERARVCTRARVSARVVSWCLVVAEDGGLRSIQGPRHHPPTVNDRLDLTLLVPQLGKLLPPHLPPSARARLRLMELLYQGQIKPAYRP